MARPRTDIAPRILKAARKCFKKQGVDATSLRAIARAARTSIGMIYYYYPTKDDLFLASIEQVYEGFLADLERTLAPNRPVEERLVALFERIAAVSDEEIEMVRLMAHEAMLSSARFERLIERFLRGHVPLILRLLIDGTQRGVLDAKRHPIVLLLATFALAGPPQMIRRAVGDRLPVPGAPAGGELARELVDVLLHGVGVAAVAPELHASGK